MDEQDSEIHGIKVGHRVGAAWQAPCKPHHPVAEVVDVARDAPPPRHHQLPSRLRFERLHGGLGVSAIMHACVSIRRKSPSYWLHLVGSCPWFAARLRALWASNARTTRLAARRRGGTEWRVCCLNGDTHAEVLQGFCIP
jgi:hypothetical protein